jgi:hypothetical protein
MSLLCTDCQTDVYKIREYAYILKKWSFGKAVLCLEARLGRPLTRSDFNFEIPLTSLPFARLTKRMQS